MPYTGLLQTLETLEVEALERTAVFDTMADGVAILEKSGAVTYANPAQLKMLGAEKLQTVLGRPWTDFYDKKDVKELSNVAKSSLRKAGKWQGFARARRLDGSYFKKRLSVTLLPNGSVVCVSNDVSLSEDLRRQENLLKQRLDAARQLETINLLTAGLTHDISNLIGLISLTSKVADIPPGLTHDELQEAMIVINWASDQMVDLLTPIKSLGRQSLPPKTKDLGAIVEKVTHLLGLGSGPELNVVSDLPDDPLVGYLVAGQLFKVLLNIGLNARDALGDGTKEIKLTLRKGPFVSGSARFDVGQIPVVPYAIISVSDTGNGISQIVRDRMWDTSFSTKTDQGGSGLGLPIVAEIIRGIGGAISVNTQHGMGTVFHVLWPLNASVTDHTRQ
ncbi:MAG: two-component system sensor histidine kinase NtrB [Marivita sp.]|uniref:two-component system sensor histidine kinase NtrB n=1 Tax=Marivita sp. TaxID=2003365 RepID=UPI003EF695F8